MINRIVILVAFSMLFLNGSSQVFKNMVDRSDSDNAINIGGMGGLQTTGISINYERIIKEKHGFMIGLPIIDIKGKERGISLAYRNHFKKTINSGFFSVFINFSKIEHKVDAYGYNLSEYNYNFTSLTIGPNLGKRWVAGSGVNFAARIGYGFKLANKIEWIDIPEDEDMREETEAFLKVISGFDIELSIGYCF